MKLAKLCAMDLDVFGYYYRCLEELRQKVYYSHLAYKIYYNNLIAYKYLCPTQTNHTQCQRLYSPACFICTQKMLRSLRAT